MPILKRRTTWSGMSQNAITPLALRDNTFRLSDELIAALRQRVAQDYYGRPEVIEIIARAILHSRFVYY
jgi:bifunctional pyridoxal-dependent enzyme with beta-cystathionase and maltose regulon repressor activities